MRIAAKYNTYEKASFSGKNIAGEWTFSCTYSAPKLYITVVALVGGGSNPHPGEISLAHNGVLFLDELPEYKRSVLEVMRQPLEDRKISVSPNITMNHLREAISYRAHAVIVPLVGKEPDKEEQWL